MNVNKFNYDKIKKEVSAKEASLSKEDQILAELRTNAQAKSLPTIWAIWIAFGIWGGHRFYMGNSTAPAMLIGTILGILTCWIFGLGFLILLAMVIWKIVDACHLGQWIRCNRLGVKKQVVESLLK